MYASGEDYDVNLRIDNFDYDKLLFLSPNFNNKEVLTFKSGLMLNDVEITSQMQIEEWSQQELISIIKHKMGSKEIVKAKISGLDQCKAVTDEMFDLFVKLNFPKNGL